MSIERALVEIVLEKTQAIEPLLREARKLAHELEISLLCQKLQTTGPTSLDATPSLTARSIAGRISELSTSLTFLQNELSEFYHQLPF